MYFRFEVLTFESHLSRDLNGVRQYARQKNKQREGPAMRCCPGGPRASWRPLWLGEVVDEVRQVAGSQIMSCKSFVATVSTHLSQFGNHWGGLFITAASTTFTNTEADICIEWIFEDCCILNFLLI